MMKPPNCFPHLVVFVFSLFSAIIHLKKYFFERFKEMFSRLWNCIKLTWMLTWRLFVVNLFLQTDVSLQWYQKAVWVLLGISFVITVIFGVGIRFFPFIRLVASMFGISQPPLFRLPGIKAEKDRALVRRIFKKDYGVWYANLAMKPIALRGSIEKPTQDGKMTGFEPSVLKDVDLPIGAPFMVGSPGTGLHSSGFSQKNVKTGVLGELNFAKALHTTGLLSQVKTFWSVRIPGYQTDVDCVIFTGKYIFLVDTKFYQSGDVTYKSSGKELFCVDNPTGLFVETNTGVSREMSKNMEMAWNIFQEEMPNAKLVPVVVFVPTDKGCPEVDRVVWPGGVPGFSLPRFLEILSHQEPYNENAPSALYTPNFEERVQ